MTTKDTAGAADQHLDTIASRMGHAGRLALLACAFPLAPDDTLAEKLIRFVTGTDTVGAGLLLRHVKTLDCVTVGESHRDWFIQVGPRNELVRRAATELPPACAAGLRRHAIAHAERLAQDLKPYSLADRRRLLGLRYEAAYHRLFLAGGNQAGTAALGIVELYERADQLDRHFLASRLDRVAPEMELLPGGVPAQLSPLLVAAREGERTPTLAELGVTAARPTPILAPINPDSTARIHELIIHLCDRDGTRPDPHGGPQPLHYYVARCDQVIRDYDADPLGNKDDLDDHTLCDGCGTREDFAAACGAAQGPWDEQV